jgi:predicted nucleic acid-binding protein
LNFYVDTSVLIAAFTNEAAKGLAQNWLGVQDEGSLLSSDWVATEFSAALSIKIRTGQINGRHRAAALAGFQRLITDSFAVLSIEKAHFRTAARFADQFATGLQAGDTLHLALSDDARATMVTLDHRLVSAATSLGLNAQLL